MSESGYYPPGAENDPRAPWNQPEPDECPDCDGVGTDPDTGRECGRCEGTGQIEPPTREEIEEERAERLFDQMRDEGEI